MLVPNRPYDIALANELLSTIACVIVKASFEKATHKLSEMFFKKTSSIYNVLVNISTTIVSLNE